MHWYYSFNTGPKINQFRIMITSLHKSISAGSYPIHLHDKLGLVQSETPLQKGYSKARHRNCNNWTISLLLSKWRNARANEVTNVWISFWNNWCNLFWRDYLKSAQCVIEFNVCSMESSRRILGLPHFVTGISQKSVPLQRCFPARSFFTDA